MGMDNDIFHKFTHKFIPITTIYDQLPNGPGNTQNTVINMDRQLTLTVVAYSTVFSMIFGTRIRHVFKNFY